jgi:predicted dienelactone hydrolase
MTSAGLRTLTLPGLDSAAARVPVLYPTDASAEPVPLGPYELDLAPGAPVRPGRAPLVVVSHGTGGTPLVYRGLAADLARAGFLVALPTHPGNSRDDDSLAGTAENLAARPRHLRRVVDAVLADDVVGRWAGPVAVVGHSMGGCTALAAAGGRPTAFPHETPERSPRPVDVEPDERVRALVLLAPATAWFAAEGALAGVGVPVLVLTAEHDPYTPRWHGDVVVRGVAGPVELRVVPGAGHFSFLTPFPPSMVVPAFPPSQDPPGFDRAAFATDLAAEVAAFLRRVL